VLSTAQSPVQWFPALDLVFLLPQKASLMWRSAVWFTENEKLLAVADPIVYQSSNSNSIKKLFNRENSCYVELLAQSRGHHD
jgi:hypothetical protein